MIQAQNFQNNIIKTPLIVDHDFDLAQAIFDLSEKLSYHDVKNIYSKRIDVAQNFIGTYQVTVSRLASYNNFLNRLYSEIEYNKNVVDVDKIPKISFEDWKSGYVTDAYGRKQKIGKLLNKHGFSKYLIDFYSRQVKTEGTYYLTISDRVQHIAGMSFFSDGSWDSMNGSSCQDPRYSEYSIQLIGSLYDNKILVAFLHKNLDDLEKMEIEAWNYFNDLEYNFYDYENVEQYTGKIIARSVCRLVTCFDRTYLISTKNYGSTITKNDLESVIKQLNQFGIFSINQMENGRFFKDSTNGFFEIEDYIEISDFINETVEATIDCPYCGGKGKIEIPSTIYDLRPIKIDCPYCDGKGKLTKEIEIYENFTEEVLAKIPVPPYAENYEHNGDHVIIKLDKKVLGID